MNQNEKALAALKKIAELDHGHKSSAIAMNAIKELESQPVAGQMGEWVDINGHEIESAVDEAWDKNAVDFLGVEQRSMTYREFVTAGYEIAKTFLSLRTAQQTQAPEVEVTRDELGIAWMSGWISKQRIDDKIEAGLNAVFDLIASGKNVVFEHFATDEDYDEYGDPIKPELYRKIERIMIDAFLPYGRVDTNVLGSIEDSCTAIHALLTSHQGAHS